MIIQGREVPNGWPFGLGSMNTRLSIGERVEADTGTRQPNTFHGPSSSFSSFSSSNFDTESTASFFQDKSVSLGRLIGLRPRDNGTLYFPRPACIPQQRPQRCEEPSYTDQTETPRGICVPNLLNMLVKMSRSKSHSRQ
ncbi:hypothetical protein M8C21_025037 [Ambrosia artemisiifolia]|uniref:Uncharacterized protein n=1 Tax=Ambrosia artemisiifolia TaxID=4212 RepID=A0AAD5GV57_AMBAR|nr:hypothetical protein M8C21_025037 [Ambrosia artemisiifolia]